jgi:hypothetical protein
MPVYPARFLHTSSIFFLLFWGFQELAPNFWIDLLGNTFSPSAHNFMHPLDPPTMPSAQGHMESAAGGSSAKQGPHVAVDGCWWLTLGADPEEPTVLVAIMIVVLIYGKVTTSSCSSSFGVKSLAPLFLKVRLFSKGSCSQPMDWTRGACPKGWDTNVPCAFWGLTARCGHRAPCQNARTHARID